MRRIRVEMKGIGVGMQGMNQGGNAGNRTEIEKTK